jgi:hypothetical protein
MRAWRYGIAAAVVCSGIVVVPTAAAPPSGEPQQADTTPMAVAPVAPYGQRATQPRPVTAPGDAPPSQRQSRVNWDATGMRGFSVALVIGDLTGASTAADNLPAGAKKALSDMRDFLPYKSYRLLDTHWILCCSSSQANVAGRLRGSEEGEYSFQIYARPVSESAELAITFSLRDVSAGFSGTANQAVASVLSSAERSRRLEELHREYMDLERRHSDARAKSGDNRPDEVKLRTELENARLKMQELERGSRARTMSRSTRPVLDSTFNMKVGETVVIGTSRLKGDKALIALLTAASRTSTAPR